MSGNSGRVQVPVSGLRHLVISTRRSTCQCLDSGTWQQGSLMVLGLVLFRIFQVKLLMLMFSASSVTMRCSWQCGLFEKLFFWNSIPWCNLTIVKYIALMFLLDCSSHAILLLPLVIWTCQQSSIYTCIYIFIYIYICIIHIHHPQ